MKSRAAPYWFAMTVLSILVEFIAEPEVVQWKFQASDSGQRASSGIIRRSDSACGRLAPMPVSVLKPKAPPACVSRYQ